MGFPRQEYWRESPFPSPGDLPNPGMELVSTASPALAGRFFTTEPPGKTRLCSSQSLRGTPRILPPDTENLAYLPPTIYQVYSACQIEYNRNKEMTASDSEDHRSKKPLKFPAFLLTLSFSNYSRWGKVSYVVWEVTWRGPCHRELSSPANSYMSDLEVKPSAPVRFTDDCNFSKNLIETSQVLLN